MGIFNKICYNLFMKNLFKDCLLILFVVVIMFFITEQPSFSGTLKFVQLSDIHYSLVEDDSNGYKLLAQSRPLLKDAICQINNIKNVDFVMITGDGIDKPEKTSLYKLTAELNKIKYPWYFALGNHDTTTSGYLTKTNFLKILKETNHNYKFDSLYYTFKPKKGFRVIVLDGAKNKGISSHGILPQEQLDWLDSILTKSKNDIVLIYLHFPLITPYEDKMHDIINKEEFKNVLKKYKMPIAIFTGHYHAAKITKRGNILHVSTPALAGYPNAFRVVEVDNSRRQVIFKIQMPETNLKELQTKTRILTLGGAKFYGRERDRNATIIIEK